MNKFYPKYNYVDINKINEVRLDPKKEVRFKVTRISEYGERYKLFVINKNTFQEEYNVEEYGMNIIKEINEVRLEPKKEVRFKVTRISEYGERYKLFVINKNTFEKAYSIEEYGMNVVKENDKYIIDTLKWNGKAKKNGFEMGDYISEFKIENVDRPSKIIIYPLAILLLIIFGYMNSRRASLLLKPKF